MITVPCDIVLNLSNCPGQFVCRNIIHAKAVLPMVDVFAVHVVIKYNTRNDEYWDLSLHSFDELVLASMRDKGYSLIIGQQLN